MKSPYSRYIERRRREIAREREELAAKISELVPQIENIARRDKNPEARKLARRWLALVMPEERARAAM